MNLREWILKPLKFLNLLPKSGTAKGNPEKAFSIPWNYTKTKFTYVEDSLTKRGKLKILTRIFDPLGLVTPVTFHGKVFLEERRFIMG